MLKLNCRYTVAAWRKRLVGALGAFGLLSLFATQPQAQDAAQRLVGTWHRSLSGELGGANHIRIQLFPTGRFLETIEVVGAKIKAEGRFSLQGTQLVQVYDSTGAVLVSAFRIESVANGSAGTLEMLRLKNVRIRGELALVRETWSGRLFPPAGS